MAYHPQVFAPSTPESYVATELDTAVMPMFAELVHTQRARELNNMAQIHTRNQIIAYHNLTYAIQCITDNEVSAAVSFTPISQYVANHEAQNDKLYTNELRLRGRADFLDAELNDMLVDKEVVVTPLDEADFIVRTVSHMFGGRKLLDIRSSTEPFTGTVEFVDGGEVKLAKSEFPLKTKWTRFYPIVLGQDEDGPAWVQRYSFDFA